MWLNHVLSCYLRSRGAYLQINLFLIRLQRSKPGVLLSAQSERCTQTTRLIVFPYELQVNLSAGRTDLHMWSLLILSVVFTSQWRLCCMFFFFHFTCFLSWFSLWCPVELHFPCALAWQSTGVPNHTSLKGLRLFLPNICPDEALRRCVFLYSTRVLQKSGALRSTCSSTGVRLKMCFQWNGIIKEVFC